MKYRAEIDGLRALAVVPVILFHAGFELFGGGFVGVDVFFVISGYLITTILIDEIENKRFSISNFYERRARRILPALFFVMLVCVPFAWKLFNPPQFREFSQSIFATTIFMSNFFFWKKTDYFGLTAEEKPLLHTWSLAVEEQYYVLFPLFLILAWRLGKNRVFWMIVVMAVISLLLSEWGWRNKATANFYLAPTRAWELFAGSIAAFMVQKKGLLGNNILASLGLGAILFSIMFYDEYTPFPSMYALVPVLGVILILLYADSSTTVSKILSTKAFRGLGLISFSAYLWHQPVLVFTKMAVSNELHIFHLASIVVGIIFISFLTWRYIETPFRNSTIVSSRSIVTLSAFGFLVFAIFGLGISSMNYKNIGLLQLKKGMIYELNYDALKQESIDLTKRYGYEDLSDFTSSKVRLLILGDSIADDFTSSIRISEKLSDVFEVRHLNYDDLCFNPQYFSNQCELWRSNIVARNSLFEKADVVAVVVGLHPHTDIASFAQDFNYIKDKTILIGSAHFHDPFEFFDVQGDRKELASLLSQNKSAYTIESNSRARELLSSIGYKFFSIYDLVCVDDFFCEATDDLGNLFIFDSAHRTRAGIEHLSDQIEQSYEVVFQLNIF